MTLVLDRRAGLAGRPGLHVLIAGVSAYAHLPGGTGVPLAESYGMKQLSSAALSALAVYDWVLAHEQGLPVPLATVRLLLSPSAGELSADGRMAALGEPSTFAAFKAAAGEWRGDAATRDDNVTLFYFAGHGVQRSRNDSVMLMEDFGADPDDILGCGASAQNLFDGMAPTDALPRIARTQFYFVDACRVMPKQFKEFEQLETGKVWNIRIGTADDRRWPVFFAAVAGDFAYSPPPGRRQPSLFCQALLACLNGDAATALRDDITGQTRWVVTTNALSSALDRAVAQVNEDTPGAQQDFQPTGGFRDVTLLALDGPPLVPVTFQVDPQDALSFVWLEVLDRHDQPVLSAPAPVPQPLECRLAAGTYRVRATIRPPDPRFHDFTDNDAAPPPGRNWKVSVST